LSDAEQAGSKFGESIGAGSLAALRAKSAEALAGAGGFQARANADGWVLPDEVHAIFTRGRQNDVPLLIGSNADEGTIFTQATVTGDSFREQSQRRFGQEAAEFLKLYPFTSDQDAWRAQAASMRDQTFGWEMRTWARQQSRTGKSNVYLYYFSRVPPGPNAARVGSQHGAEIAYVFDWVNGETGSDAAWQQVDRKLADQLSSYWVNFASTGDPNGKGMARWPPFLTKDEVAMGLGDAIGMAPLPHTAALDFLDRYFERLRQSGHSQ
jgi:para-nitrobenzyl esterase